MLKKSLKWDDALDVWGVHGVGGTIGIIMLGIFATTAVNSSGANGLIFGGVSFFFKEIIAVIGASIYAFVFSYGMLVTIHMITPVKVSEMDEETGMDEALHGEVAYLSPAGRGSTLHSNTQVTYRSL
jgi:Amt family ammonium transporter